MSTQDDLYEFVKKINNKRDFEHFLKLLNEDFIRNKDDWENDTLGNYLEALYASNSNTTENENSGPPSWKGFAEILLTAIVYE